MLKLFWVVMLLVGILLFSNAREAVMNYFIDYNKTKLITYMFPLLLLGYMVVHLTFKVIDFSAVAENDVQEDELACPRYASAATIFRLKSVKR